MLLFMDKSKYTRIFIPRAGFYLWIIFIMVVVIAILELKVAIPGFILFAFLVYYNYRSNYIRQKELTKYIENLTFNIDTATKDTLLRFPMPLLLVEVDGTIIWYNSSFRSIFGNGEQLENTIKSLVANIKLDSNEGHILNISKPLKIEEKYFNILGNVVKLEKKNEKQEYILMFYFLDVTDHELLKEKYEAEKVAAAIIIIDNYDDLMQSMDDVNRQQILADIDRRIMSWSAFTQGIVKKYERDKYIFIFEKRFLKEFEDKKFDILDNVKEISLGNKIPVTLSFGVGINGGSLAECFSYANAALDIALGRGGDQVVIKNVDQFTFYGGKTREHEKRTKVKARVIAYALRELIGQSEDVLIMGHENADLDSLGASLGIYGIVKKHGKNVHLVLNSSNVAIDSLLSKIRKDPEYDGAFVSRNEALEIVNRKTLLIVVDTYRPSFTECPELLEYTGRIVVIDHHRKSTEFIKDAVLTYQETYASSTCELVTEILMYIEDKPNLSVLEAEALYSGIVLDTKNFTFKTGVRTFEAASFLRRQGVDTIRVKQLFKNDMQTYITRSEIVKNAEIINNNIAISTCPPNIKNMQLIAAQAADELLGLSGVVAAFVLSSENNTVSISGRSLGDINVQLILEKLGGGGHLTVAGAQLHDISLEDANEKLKCAIIEYINNDVSSNGNG